MRKPVRKCFDWIGGTSTGGILALGIQKPVRECFDSTEEQVLADLLALVEIDEQDAKTCQSVLTGSGELALVESWP